MFRRILTNLDGVQVIGSIIVISKIVIRNVVVVIVVVVIVVALVWIDVADHVGGYSYGWQQKIDESHST